MKNIKAKYGALLLRNINQEHAITRSFGLEYNDDSNVNDLLDLILKPKYKSFEEFSNTIHSNSHPNPFWDYTNQIHMSDAIDDEIFKVAWDKDFYKLDEEQRIGAYLKLKKKCDKTIKKIEHIKKTLAKGKK